MNTLKPRPLLLVRRSPSVRRRSGTIDDAGRRHAAAVAAAAAEACAGADSLADREFQLRQPRRSVQ